jgi:hypothetical protein
MICFNIDFDININIESTLSDLMDDYLRNKTLILSQFYI